MKVWLVGMMGSGKTSAGEIAARKLDVPFMDTDRMVEAEVGMSVAEFWAESGEEEFREVEHSVIEGLVDVEGVVATGGGVVLREANRRILTGSGLVVWLVAEPSTLVSRLSESSNRPLLPPSGDRVGVMEKVLGNRSHLYESVADHRIDTGELESHEVAREIEALWRL